MVVFWFFILDAKERFYTYILGFCTLNWTKPLLTPKCSTVFFFLLWSTEFHIFFCMILRGRQARGTSQKTSWFQQRNSCFLFAIEYSDSRVQY